MKKYISIVLCLVCFVTAVLINYDAPMAGKGKGTSETVSNIEELSSVINGVAAMMNLNFSSDAATASEEKKSDYDSVTLEVSYNVDATASLSIFDEAIATHTNQSIQIETAGEEVWYVDRGGDRLYVECSARMRTIDHLSAENNLEISMNAMVYYGKEVGWFIKYTSFQMAGAVLPGQILNKWISLNSIDEYMNATEMFSQLLGRSYNFLLTFDESINEKKEEAFDVSETMYRMKEDTFKKLATDMFNQFPDIRIPGLDASLGDLNDVNGFLKADLSEKDAPHLEYFCDMDYDATISGVQIHYLSEGGQDIALKNINNTVVAELDLSQVYDIEDLMIGG